MEFMDIFIYFVYFVGLFVIVFYITTFLEKKQELKSKVTTTFPLISVIIPVYNKAKIIKHTLSFIKKQDYPKDKIEIICVDDGSQDNSLKVLTSIKGITAITKKNGGKASALNYGIKKAKGNIICCLDSDTYIRPDVFKKAAYYFENDPKTGVVIASLQPYNPKNLLQRIQVVEYTLASFFRKMTTFNQGLSAAPACSFFRAEIFNKYGGYDEASLTEDFDMALRVQANHYKMHHLLDTVAYTDVPETFRDLSRQRLRWCYGTFQTLKKYRKLLNVKYGDFGVFFMPLIMFSVGLSILAFIMISSDMIARLIRNLHLLQLVNFDLTMPLSNLSFLYVFSDLKIILGAILISFALFILYLAKKHTISEKISIATYLLYAYLYSLILIIFWMISLVYFAIGKRPRW
jgi:cellulose synthase/poly-beta-1,6-N-acetylglucosamine synthase-like glycosyltransferase